MGKPENSVESYLVKACADRGWLCWKFVSPGNNGVPDRIVIGDGLITLVELKSPVGHLRTLQCAIHGLLRRHGVEPLVAHTRPEADAVMAMIARRASWLRDARETSEISDCQ